MSFKRFGFGASTSSGGGGADLSKLKVNQPVTTADFINFSIPAAASPIVPGTLKVYVNGVDQATQDFELTPDGMGFTWLSATPLILVGFTYHIDVDFTLS